jgi:hypothetical protein
MPTAEIVDCSNDFGGLYRAPERPMETEAAAAPRKRLMPTVILYGRWHDIQSGPRPLSAFSCEVENACSNAGCFCSR